MKLFRFLLPLLAALSFASSAAYAGGGGKGKHNDETRFNEELNERDWDALQDYINTKRTINVAEKSTNLAISGDMRTEWRHVNETCHDRKLRGGRRTDPRTDCGGDHIDFDFDCKDKKKESESHKKDRKDHKLNCKRLPLSHNVFNIEANLFIEYVCDRAWGIAYFQFDNPAGIDGSDKKCLCAPEALHGSGFSNGINLKRSYLGYNFFDEEGSRFDIEIGRRPLYTIFDSEIEFLSRFDGILFKYDNNCQYLSDWYIHAGAFVVDQRIDQFSFVAEIGLLNICDSGYDFKYSFIDWENHWWNNEGRNRCGLHDPLGSKFLVSQFLVYYHLDPECLCAPAEFYGALLWNTAASRHHKLFRMSKEEEAIINANENKTLIAQINREHKSHSRHNFAWYAGFLLGEVISEGDWSFEIEYQYVQARAIPDEDVSGIGRGNIIGDHRTNRGRGNTNYKGWRLQSLYAVTDNLSLDARFQWSTQINKKIGGQHSYSEFRLQTIFAY